MARNDPRTPLDRGLQTLLADELAGRQPPDLTAKIVAAAARPRAPANLPATAEPRRSLVRGMLIGAAAVGGLWLAGAFASAEPGLPEPVVTGRVARGAVAWRPAADAGIGDARAPGGLAPETYDAGREFAWPLRRGDRLAVDADRPGTIELDAMGRLVLQPHTTLEVTNVEWKHLAGGFVAGSITVTALAGAASWYGGGETAKEPGESLVLAARHGDDPDLASGIAGELDAARERIAELEARLASEQRTAVAPAPDTAAAGGAAEVPVASAAVELIATGSSFDDLLADVDWQQVGEAVDGYIGVKREIEELIAAGEDVPMELRAAEGRWEGLLFQQVAAALEDVPGESVTARIHHPAFGTNLLHAAMSAAGLALDGSQQRWLADIGRRYTAEDAQRRAGYGDQTLALERFVDEIEMQHRFFEEQRAVLSPAQHDRISFGELAERVLVDPLGSGFQWSKKNRVVQVESREALARSAATGFADDLGLTGAQQAALAPMVRRWVSRWPSRWLDRPMDALDRSGRMHIERVRTAARLQLELMREMQQGLALSPEQLDVLLRQQLVYVPFLTS